MKSSGPKHYFKNGPTGGVTPNFNLIRTCANGMSSHALEWPVPSGQAVGRLWPFDGPKKSLQGPAFQIGQRAVHSAQPRTPAFCCVQPRREARILRKDAGGRSLAGGGVHKPKGRPVLPPGGVATKFSALSVPHDTESTRLTAPHCLGAFKELPVT